MADIEKTGDVDKALGSVDQAKRETLRKMITGAAYVAPIVTSFAIDGMFVSTSMATNSLPS